MANVDVSAPLPHPVEEKTSVSYSSILQTVTPLLVIAVGVVEWIFGNQLSRQQQALQNSIENRTQTEDFVKMTQQSIAQLAGKDQQQAKMNFAALYYLSQNDPRKKWVLVNIAAASENNALMNVLSDEMTGEAQLSKAQIANDPNIIAIARILKARANSARPTSSKQEPVATTASDRVLANLTPPNSVGWVYLGIGSAGKNKVPILTSDARAVVVPKDKNGNVIMTTSAPMNLHADDQQGGTRTPIIGVLPIQSKILVDGVKEYGLQSAQGNAVWARVTLIKR